MRRAAKASRRRAATNACDRVLALKPLLGKCSNTGQGVASGGVTDCAQAARSHDRSDRRNRLPGRVAVSMLRCSGLARWVRWGGERRRLCRASVRLEDAHVQPHGESDTSENWF